MRIVDIDSDEPLLYTVRYSTFPSSSLDGIPWKKVWDSNEMTLETINIDNVIYRLKPKVNIIFDRHSDTIFMQVGKRFAGFNIYDTNTPPLLLVLGFMRGLISTIDYNDVYMMLCCSEEIVDLNGTLEVS
jgi:hypothetical protein